MHLLDFVKQAQLLGTKMNFAHDENIQFNFLP